MISTYFQGSHCLQQKIPLFNLSGTYMFQINQENHKAQLLFFSIFLLRYMQVTSSTAHLSTWPYFVIHLLV